jgi:hypothetical protein
VQKQGDRVGECSQSQAADLGEAGVGLCADSLRNRLVGPRASATGGGCYGLVRCRGKQKRRQAPKRVILSEQAAVGRYL